jgi:hypothetical protein
MNNLDKLVGITENINELNSKMSLVFEQLYEYTEKWDKAVSELEEERERVLENGDESAKVDAICRKAQVEFRGESNFWDKIRLIG